MAGYLNPDGFKQAYRAVYRWRFIYDDYLPQCREAHRSIRTIKSRIKPIVAALGRKPLNRVIRDDILSAFKRSKLKPNLLLR